jgi:hypothetical protein
MGGSTETFEQNQSWGARINVYDRISTPAVGDSVLAKDVAC